jgi:hypothetical protein
MVQNSLLVLVEFFLLQFKNELLLINTILFVDHFLFLRAHL